MLSIPGDVLKMQLLPYLPGRDLFSLATTCKSLLSIAKEGIDRTSELFLFSSIDRKRKWETPLEEAGEDFCRLSQKTRKAALEFLSEKEALPHLVSFAAEVKERKKLKRVSELALKKNPTRQRKSLTKQAIEWADEGFSYEPIRCLDSIRNRNRRLSFIKFLRELIHQEKYQKAFEIAFGIDPQYERDMKFSLTEVLRQLVPHHKVKKLFRAIEEVEPANSVESSAELAIISPKKVALRLSFLIRDWRFPVVNTFEAESLLLDALSSLKKVHLAQWICLDFLLLGRRPIMAFLKEPLLQILVIEMVQAASIPFTVPQETLYEQLFSVREYEGWIQRLKLLVLEHFFDNDLVSTTSKILDTLKAEGKEADSLLIENLEGLFASFHE